MILSDRTGRTREKKHIPIAEDTDSPPVPDDIVVASFLQAEGLDLPSGRIVHRSEPEGGRNAFPVADELRRGDHGRC